MPDVSGAPDHVARLTEGLLPGAIEAASVRNVQLDLGVTGWLGVVGRLIHATTVEPGSPYEPATCQHETKAQFDPGAYRDPAGSARASRP